jgi:hypothetical protein
VPADQGEMLDGGTILFVVGAASSLIVRCLDTNFNISTHLALYERRITASTVGSLVPAARSDVRPLLPVPVTEGIWFGHTTVYREVVQGTSAFGSGTHAIFCDREFEIATSDDAKGSAHFHLYKLLE